MILVASAVEANLVNTGVLGPLGNDTADEGRRGFVSTVFELTADLGVHRARRDEGRGRIVIDELGVNVLRATEDRQPRPESSTEESIADPALTPQAASLNK
jgi:hypothetical protein